VAVAQSVLALPSSLLDQWLRTILTAEAVVLGVILLTAGLLYPVILRLFRLVLSATQNLVDSNIETLEVLGAGIAKRDSDTDAHNYRVTLYALKLAEDLGLDEDRLRRLIVGSFLHDIGKLGTPDAILHKPGRLTDDEFAVMRQHVAHGEDIIHGSRWLRLATPVVSGHHEKFDGSGYPRGLAKYDIPLEARIFALADVFDALTSERPYKQAFTLEKALDIMKDGRGTHFDADLFDRFEALAPDLHRAYAGRSDDRLREELRQATTARFRATVAALTY
jgi:HD-GYP domain-containing protein (c-di-GMP phosphodiesterase class II)